MQKNSTVELVDAMFKISRLFKHEMTFTHKLVHLSILQIQTLIFLVKSKDKKVSMGDIAEYFQIELSSATSLLNKLYDQKLVERHPDVEDRRLVLITLSAQGKRLVVQAMADRRKKLEEMLSYLSEQEKQELLNIFGTIGKRLQK